MINSPKRKPGRPRKIESEAFVESVAKRGPGRPRKNASSEASAGSTAPKRKYVRRKIAINEALAFDSVRLSVVYTVLTPSYDGSDNSQHVSGTGFSFASNGDLLIESNGEIIAAFHSWHSIVRNPEVPQPQIPEVTLSAAQSDNPFDFNNNKFNGVAGLEVPSATLAETSAFGAQTVTFPNGVELIETDRPE